MTRSGYSVAGAFSSMTGAFSFTSGFSGAGCSSTTSGSGFANIVHIQAPINVKRGYPSEIKAPTPTNAIKAMNQTFVRADSHASKMDEYLSWKIGRHTSRHDAEGQQHNAQHSRPFRQLALVVILCNSFSPIFHYAFTYFWFGSFGLSGIVSLSLPCSTRGLMCFFLFLV